MATKAEMKKVLGKPVRLARNTYMHFYNGGKLRAEFVGEKNPRDDFRSEEWIFSTNRAVTPGRPNPPTKGISRVALPGGKRALMTDFLKAFPAETVGKKHYKRFGPNLGILVKIFDVGNGAHIPVHWHPSPEFARKYLPENPFGKNEAWLVIGKRPGGRAWIGWKSDIEKKDFKKWMDAQDVKKMRSMMYEVRPKVGDVIFLRATYVHSLDHGLCNLEPQEPTDWNILAEWGGIYPFGKEDASCGLDWDIALKALDYKKMPKDYLMDYVLRTPKTVRKEGKSREDHLVPNEAKKFFDLYRLTIYDRLSMPGDRGFYCVITTKGEGKAEGPFGSVPIRRGQSLFITTSLPGFDFVNTGSGPLEIICWMQGDELTRA